MDLFTFIPEQFLLLAVALYVIGVALKKTEFLKDKYIPIVMLALGALGGLAVGYTIQYAITDSFLVGILCGGLAVGINQVFVQSKKTE